MAKEKESLEIEVAGMDEKFRTEQEKRKLVLNELEDLKGKIRVYCRIRPLSNSEKQDPEKAAVSVKILD